MSSCLCTFDAIISAVGSTQAPYHVAEADLANDPTTRCLLRLQIAASLDKILEGQLKFKKHKPAKTGKRKATQTGDEQEEEEEGQPGPCSTSAAGGTAAVGTGAAASKSAPAAPHDIDYGTGVRLFKHVKRGLPAIECIVRTSGVPQDRVTPGDLLEGIRAKRARQEAWEAALCAVAGPAAAMKAVAAGAATAAGTVGAQDTAGGNTPSGADAAALEARAKKEAKRARKAAKEALKALSVEGAEVERSAAAAAARTAAGVGLTLPGEAGKVKDSGTLEAGVQGSAQGAVQRAAEAGDGVAGAVDAGGVSGSGDASAPAAKKKKKKKAKARKLVPAPGTVVEAKAWVPFEVRTAKLLGLQAPVTA